VGPIRRRQNKGRNLSIGFIQYVLRHFSIIMDVDKKKELKERKAAKPKTTTALDKIIAAIRALKGGPNGSSRAAISKYLKVEFDYDNANALKTALKKGVSTQKLVQSGQSFRVAGDAIAVVQQQQEEEGIQQEDLKVGTEGPEAVQGDEVTVAYVGTLDNGYQFDMANSFHLCSGQEMSSKGGTLASLE
jgi:FKBP-type peptidyl-prolyl cis-trans isomerase